jgi:3-hydroxyisobutyrate dehydrogenase-like beta-hydroxyacid dehydrogenase
MGAGMARNLRAKIEPGASLQVYDLHRDACQALAKEVNGIEVVNEIKDLSSAVVLCMSWEHD